MGGMPGWMLPFAAIVGAGELSSSVSKVIGTLNEVNEMRSRGNYNKNLKQFAKDPYTETFDDRYMLPKHRLALIRNKKDWFASQKEKDLLRSKKYALENFAYRRRDQPNIPQGQIWDQMQKEGVIDPSVIDPTEMKTRMGNLEFGRKEADTRAFRQKAGPAIGGQFGDLVKGAGGRVSTADLSLARTAMGVGTGKKDPDVLSEPQARKLLRDIGKLRIKLETPDGMALVAQALGMNPEEIGADGGDLKQALLDRLDADEAYANRFVPDSKKKENLPSKKDIQYYIDEYGMTEEEVLERWRAKNAK